MTLSLLELLSVLAVPLVLGAALLRLQGVGPRTDALAFAGWCWIQGSLGLAIVLSAWLWLGLPLRASALVPVLLALAALAWTAGRRVPLAAPSPVTAPRWERALFLLGLAFLLVTTADRTLLAAGNVLATSDEARIYAAKAKVMFQAGGFGDAFRAEVRSPEIVGHADYPPLNALLQLWVHAHAGEIVHVESRLPMQMFPFALILLAASATRRRARPFVALLFLVCTGTLGRFFSYQVFSDALIAVGLLACWDLWQRYQEDGALVWPRLAATSAVLLVWSKNEGLLHVVAFVLALLAAAAIRRVRLPARGEALRLAAWTAPLVGSVLYLQWFNAHFGLVNDLVQARSRAGGALFLERARAILVSFGERIGKELDLTHGLLLVFLALLVVPGAALGRGRATLTFGLVLALLGYMAVYLGTHWDIEEHLAHSSHRLVYHLAPAAGLWVLAFVVEALPRAAARPELPAPGG